MTWKCMHVSDHQHQFPYRLHTFSPHFIPAYQQLHLQSVNLMKLADDATSIGLIKGGDESACTQKILLLDEYNLIMAPFSMWFNQVQ